MPRGTQTSPYQRVRNQAQTALRRIQTDIRGREAELDKLRQHEESLQSFVGGRTNSAAPKRGSGQRIDWREVLSKLPKQFKAADLRKVRGIAQKKSSEIFAAITRWIEAKLVKRKNRGVYERVG